MKNERIIWLDGIKGLSCLCIFLHHFMLTFFNASYFGEEAVSRTVSGLDVRLSYAPYGVIVNGNFWLCIFFLISAFFISRQIFSIMSDDKPSYDRISTILCKRYPRLMLPIAALSLLNYFLIPLLSVCGLNYMNAENTLSFPDFLFHILIKMWLTVDTSVQGNYWMLSFLLFSCFLAVLLTLAAGKSRKHMLPVYLLLLYVCGSIHSLYVSTVLAVILAYELDRGQIFPFLKSRKWLRISSALFLLLSGLWLGGYPSYVEPANFYRHFGFFTHRVPEAYQMIHCFGAFCFISAFFLLHKLTIPFSAKIFQWAGKLSFGIYLIHPLILLYIGYYLMDTLAPLMPGYSVTGIIVFFILLIILLAASFLFHVTIEKYCDRLCRKIFS